MYFDPYLIPHVKIYLRWILVIKIKAKTISFLEENISKYIHDLEVGNNFFMQDTKSINHERKDG